MGESIDAAFVAVLSVVAVSVAVCLSLPSLSL